MCIPQLDIRQKSITILYLPFICILVVILGYLFSIAGPWHFQILSKLSQFKVFYLIVIASAVVSLMYSYLRHRPWRYFIPLVLPVLVVYIVAYNFSATPNWVSIQQNLSLTQLIDKHKDIKNTHLIKTYYDVKEFVREKKLVISPNYAFFRDVRFEQIVDSEIVLKEYPHILSDDEFAAIMKKPLKTKKEFPLKRLMPNWVSLFLGPDGKPLPAENIYAVSYEKHLFFIPEDYFMSLKGLTKADLEKYKERKYK